MIRASSPAIRSAPRPVLAVAAALVAAALCGCASVRSTAVYYTPTTQERFAPKPRGFVVPVLAERPPEAHRVIGRMRFEAPRTYRFVWDALQYNARANGADAIVIRELNEETDVFLTRVPPRFRYVGAPRYFVIRDGGRNRIVRAGPGFRPVLRPGYLRRDELVTTAVDAEMIVFQN